MKISIATSGEALTAPLDLRSGIASRYLVSAPGNIRFKVADKKNLNTAHSAGSQSTEIVVRLGAKALATGHCCFPKAFRVRVLQAPERDSSNAKSATVVKVLALCSEGTLNRALTENVRGCGA